jgi:hypothetical protein
MLEIWFIIAVNDTVIVNESLDSGSIVEWEWVAEGE